VADREWGLLSDPQVLGARPWARVGRGALAAPAQRACAARHPFHGRMIATGVCLSCQAGAMPRYTQSFHAAYPTAENRWALLPGWGKNLTL